MGAKKKAAKAGAAAAAVRQSPYVKRLAEDEELRANLVSAYESARDAVGRLQNGKHPTKQIFDDKKLQKDLKAAAESFRDASVALREAPKQKRKKRGGARGLRGPAQEGPGRAVRRGGGVRVHLDDLPGAGAVARGVGELTRPPHPAFAKGACGRPSSFHSPAMKSRTSTSAPGRSSVSVP
jgi:hypothetical protein